MALWLAGRFAGNAFVCCMQHITLTDLFVVIGLEIGKTARILEISLIFFVARILVVWESTTLLCVRIGLCCNRTKLFVWKMTSIMMWLVRAFQRVRTIAYRRRRRGFCCGIGCQLSDWFGKKNRKQWKASSSYLYRQKT